MDWKELSTREWFLAIMDDASRFIVAYGIYPLPRTPVRYRL
jgi:hypothetical protein